jgi:hypothetical protein
MRPILVCSLLFSVTAFADTHKQPHVDLVIALDVSGSMRGLIDATRVKLWDVVRLLGQAQPQPRVRVGLVTFGGKQHDAAAGWVRKELDLTTDLDAVSTRLFALSVAGSQEYVARAVQTATRDLSWDQDPSTLKILFVAGNESAEQDPRVSLAAALGEARQKRIYVNTIYCGAPETRESGGWKRVAALGRGEFAAIDHRRSALSSVTPYDAELGRLSTALSGTYVGYGAGSGARHSRQKDADDRAAADGPQVAAERAAAKASPVYDNSDWDVVDAIAKNKPVTELPPDLSRMSDSERSSFVRQRAGERAQLQQKIREIATRRDAYLAQPAKPASVAVPPAPAGSATGTVASAPPPPAPPVAARPSQKPMGDALRGAVRKQAVDNGYSF